MNKSDEKRLSFLRVDFVDRLLSLVVHPFTKNIFYLLQGTEKLLEFAQTTIKGVKTVELVDDWKLKSVEERIEQALVKVSILNLIFKNPVEKITIMFKNLLGIITNV